MKRLHRWRVLPVLIVLMFLAGCKESVTILDGEMTVSRGGIYTFVHYYTHPETDRKVIMVGMNHGGDREYFSEVMRVLRSAEVVIFEGVARPSSARSEESARQRIKGLTIQIESENMDEAFIAALQLYTLRAPRYLGLIFERDGIDHGQQNWHSGDMEFMADLQYDPVQRKKFEELQERHFGQYPQERKKFIVDFVKGELEKMDRGTFTRQDFGRSFVVVWSDPLFHRMILEVVAKPRDVAVFGVFDRLVAAQNPRIIGIKFGAGHIAYQRKLLEERGYIHRYSIPLRNLKF